MNIAAWAVREPIPPVVLFLVLVLAGSYAFYQINIQYMPDTEFPAVNVSAVLPGASAVQLETEVTRKIENALVGIEGIESITSTVSEGISVTIVQFIIERDSFEALDDVRVAVSNLGADLPTAMEQPSVTRINAVGTPIQTYAVSSDSLDEEALSWFVDNDVTRKLSAIPGLATVKRVGGVQREVRVEIDPTRLASLGLTAADVSRQLRRAQVQLSGGRGEVGDASQSLRTISTVGSARELAAFDIALPGGRHFRLEQIATVHDTIADRSQLALLDGLPVVAFHIHRSKDGNSVTIARDAARLLQELEDEVDVSFDLVIDQVQRIEDEFNASMKMLYEGAFLAMLVVFLFLRDWRATLISAIALPLSVIPTFAVIYWMGFSLNIITLLALTLVIGLLVDDTIVEVENIVRHLRQGKSPFSAAIDAAVEIGLAVVATTMTLVAVFLPTAFMVGIAGLFFQQFGWTAVLAVLASLAVARLITPMLCARFLRPHSRGATPGTIMRTYLRFAALALKHRYITSLCAAVFFFTSVAGLMMLPEEFVPAEDRSRTNINVELPPGTPLETTWEVSETVRQHIASIPEIDYTLTTIGAGDGARRNIGNVANIAQIRTAVITVNLLPIDDRVRSQTEVENEIRTRLLSIPGVRFKVSSGGSGSKLQLNLTSEDPVLLNQTADVLMREMRSVPGLGNISSNASLVQPEVLILPDLARAAELGVNATAIGETVQIATAGDYQAALAKLNLPDRQIDIRVQLPAWARGNLDIIKQLQVPGASGLVPLAAVADITVSGGPAQISRYDRIRNVQIEAELGNLKLGEATDLVDALPTLVALPHGVSKIDIGDTIFMKELFDGLGLAMLTGIGCVFMVLVLLFKDFMQPVTILAALPLCIGGSVLALLLVGASFSLPAVIGLLMLMGIATKNSILLVDYAIVAMVQGMDKYDAILDACGKRARPIVMTTFAMTAGMLPVALEGDAIRTPMAIVVIGGLLTSTVLSLVVVPVVFTFVVDVQRVVGRTFGSGGTPDGRTPEGPLDGHPQAAHLP